MTSWKDVRDRLRSQGWTIGVSEMLRETGISYLVEALNCEKKEFHALEFTSFEQAFQKLEALILSVEAGQAALAECTRADDEPCEYYREGFCIAKGDQGWEWVKERPVSCRYRLDKLAETQG